MRVTEKRILYVFTELISGRKPLIYPAFTSQQNFTYDEDTLEIKANAKICRLVYGETLKKFLRFLVVLLKLKR